jgi:hypothetical protein
VRGLLGVLRHLTHPGNAANAVWASGPLLAAGRLVAAAAWIVIPVTTFALSLAVTVDIQKILWEFVVPLPPNAVLPPMDLVALVYVFNSEWRHDREWARLDID